MFFGSYDITIITLKDKSIPSGFIKKFERIEKHRDFPMRLNIFGTDKKVLHERSILSNYWVMESGHGFDLLNSYNHIKGNKNTKLSIHGINNQKIKNSYKY